MEQCREEIPFGLSEDESMELSTYKDVLASLTAESKLTLFSDDMDSDQYSFEINDNIPNGIHELYTAPPVPEIKDHQIREMVTEITDTATKYQGCQCLRDAISKVVIKCLNGLGE